MNLKKNKKILMLTCISILTISVTVLFLNNFFTPDQTIDYKMSLIVGKTPGINADTDMIAFGRLPPTGSALRKIDLGNKGSSKKVEIKASGNLSDWTTVSENNFVLEKNENKTIKIIAKVPSEAEHGNYFGTFRVNFFEKTIWD